MFGLGMPELLVILVILLLFFGKDKLPELARSIGGAAHELKKGFAEGEIDASVEDASAKSSTKK